MKSSYEDIIAAVDFFDQSDPSTATPMEMCMDCKGDYFG